jgi:hypothetical protein
MYQSFVQHPGPTPLHPQTNRKPAPPSSTNKPEVQLFPKNDTQPWKSVPGGFLLHAIPEYLSPDRVLLTFDEDEITKNLVRVLKISRKCIVYIEASPKRSAAFGEYQREDFPLLKALMLHLPPTTRWGWQRLSTENLVARHPTVPPFIITNSFISPNARRVYDPNVVPLQAFLIENTNADIIAEHGDKDNVMKDPSVARTSDDSVCVCVRVCVCF